MKPVPFKLGKINAGSNRSIVNTRKFYERNVNKDEVEVKYSKVITVRR